MSRVDVSDLVHAALGGDAQAQRQIVEVLDPRITAIAVAILGNAYDVEDAVQSSFLELFRSLHGFQGTDLGPWARAIAVRTALRAARERRLRTARAASVDPETLGFEISLRHHHVPRNISEYLAELPKARSLALVLRHVLGYSVEEIAQQTNVSPNTVKDRLQQARRQVKQAVRREQQLNIRKHPR